MPASLRRCAVVALTAAGLAGLTWHAASRRLDLEVSPDEPVAQPDLRDEYGRSGAELERQRQIVLARHAARDEVVCQLLAGRLTLGQAAVRFRAIERENPLTPGPPWDGRYPEGERLCRDVIHRVSIYVRARQPAEVVRVAARLGAELEQLRGPDGTVRLPDG